MSASGVPSVIVRPQEETEQLKELSVAGQICIFGCIKGQAGSRAVTPAAPPEKGAHKSPSNMSKPFLHLILKMHNTNLNKCFGMHFLFL